MITFIIAPESAPQIAAPNPPPPPPTEPPKDFGEYTDADARIYGFLRVGPQRLTTVLNKAARLMPARSKRMRTAIKREILLRLTTLIRQGQLVRIRRTHIALPRAGE